MLTITTTAICQTALKQGDLLFQNLDCGDLCDAIEEVTQGRYGLKFSHIGLVYIKGDSTYIIEAIGQAVRLTPLHDFAKRTKNTIYLGRLKNEYTPLINPAVAFAIKQLGVAYDEPFIYNNNKYYCSELIYDAFKQANNNTDVFILEPMTFKKPATKDYYPAWVEYYKALKITIPEGEPGINPAGISRSEMIDWLGEFKNN